MFWKTFAVLYVAALLGALALVPYTLRLTGASGTPGAAPSPGTIALLGFAQNAVLSAVVVIIGLLAARSIGLGAPFVSMALGGPAPSHPLGSLIRSSVVIGGSIGAAMVALDLVLLPHFPPLLELARKTSLWENFTASFYGGINEELLTRLFGLSVIAWILSRVFQSGADRPTALVFWSANIGMAVLFSLGHLPAGKAVLGRITPLFVGRTLLLNAPLAIFCGRQFWLYGIEAAVLTHFTADIVYHVGGTALLLVNDRLGLLPWLAR